MQDRYAGDVGDFFKLALLERLCAPPEGAHPTLGEGAAPLSVGIVWYLVDDETHNNDGKHVGYLDPRSPAGRALRPLAPGVYDSLGVMVATGPRSVARLAASGALPRESVSYEARLRVRDLPSHDRTGRLARRARWRDAAVAAVEHCDLVCLDPDNGIRADDHAVPPHRNGAEKHSYLHELVEFAGDGRSLVAYQHADRSATVEVQARRRMSELGQALGRAPLAAVRTSRGTARLFIVVPAARHEDRLHHQLDRLARSPGAAELDVIRP